MWEYFLEDNRRVLIICKENYLGSEILLKIGDKTMFLGDFMLYESEQMALADVQYFTKMINIFSESAIVLAGPTKSLEICKSFTIFSPAIQAQFQIKADIPFVLPEMKDFQGIKLNEENMDATYSKNKETKDTTELSSVQGKEDTSKTSKKKYEEKDADQRLADNSERINIFENQPQSKIKAKLAKENIQSNRLQNFFCKNCNKSFSSKGNHKVHMKRKHDNNVILKKPQVEKQILNCKLCTKTFLQRSKLSLHLWNHKKNMIRCLLCSLKLPGKSDMKKHMEDIHKDSKKMSYNKETSISKKLSCALCGKEGFDELGELNSHIIKTHVDQGA